MASNSPFLPGRLTVTLNARSASCISWQVRSISRGCDLHSGRIDVLTPLTWWQEIKQQVMLVLHQNNYELTQEQLLFLKESTITEDTESEQDAASTFVVELLSLEYLK